MNKATSVQSFTYLDLVVSEKNAPKLTNFILWGYGLQSPLKVMRFSRHSSEMYSNDFNWIKI